MTVLQICGFEADQNITYLQREWDFFPAAAHSFSAGAFAGTTALDISSGNTRLRSRSYGLKNSLTVGMRVNFSSVPTSGSDSIRLRRGATEQIRFDFIQGSNSSFMKIQVKRGATTLATTADIAIGIFTYVEVDSLMNTATGTYAVYVNEQLLVSGAGANTADSGSNQGDVVDITLDGGTTGKIDDIYVADGTLKGDMKILGFAVNSDGATTTWTPDSGTTHFDRVNDSPTTTNDGTYVKSDTVGNLDLFGHVALAGVTTPILAVQTKISAAMEAVGTRNIREVCRSGGSNFNGGTQAISDLGYKTIFEVREVDPNTAAAWTLANLNAAQFGVEVV